MCDICVIDITGKRYRAGVIVAANSISKEDDDATLKFRETANEVVCKMMSDMHELKMPQYIYYLMQISTIEWKIE